MLLEHLDRVVQPAGLQVQLSDGGDGGIAFAVEGDRLFAELDGGVDVLLPLVGSESLVDQWKNVDGTLLIDCAEKSLRLDLPTSEMWGNNAYLVFSSSRAFSNFSMASGNR